MNPEQLKNIVMGRFQAAGLLDCLDLGDSRFSELPRFFEVAHFRIELSVKDAALATAVRQIAERMKSELSVSRGVELDVLIQTRALAGS